MAHTVAKLRIGGRDRYRVDYLTRLGRQSPKTIACDRERRWQAYAGKTMVGPAAPLPHDMVNLVDSSWLLGCRLSGGTEISHRDRRAHRLGVTRGDDCSAAGRRRRRPADSRRRLRHQELPG